MLADSSIVAQQQFQTARYHRLSDNCQNIQMPRLCFANWFDSLNLNKNKMVGGWQHFCAGPAVNLLLSRIEGRRTKDQLFHENENYIVEWTYSSRLEVNGTLNKIQFQ